MATSAWQYVLDDTFSDIEGITPTYDAEQLWRRIPRPRPEGEGARDREYSARKWVNVTDVRVFGGGEDQLGRDLMVRVCYTDAPEFEDRRHCDEQDLIAALEPTSTYPSGSWGALKARRVVREAVEIDDETYSGCVVVTYPIRLIWREQSSHV